MILNSENHIEIINSYSIQDWKPLLDLIPEIETTKVFGRYQGIEETEEGVFTLPYWITGDLIDRFFKIVYEMPIIISFHWASWDEGRRIANDPDFDFNTTDIPTKCKLITAIVRNDRFYDCALIDAFESGLMLRILKSIDQQLKEIKQAGNI
jgi:hypothetical protein